MMKKTFFFLVMACVFSSQKMHAQFSIAEVIAGGITKVIRAVDLRIQRLQNKTIWLQNAQKTLENEMTKWKLEEIRDWVEKQRKLYDDYFRELWEVKNALASYNRVRIIIRFHTSIPFHIGLSISVTDTIFRFIACHPQITTNNTST